MWKLKLSTRTGTNGMEYDIIFSKLGNFETRARQIKAQTFYQRRHHAGWYVIESSTETFHWGNKLVKSIAAAD